MCNLRSLRPGQIQWVSFSSNASRRTVPTDVLTLPQVPPGSPRVCFLQHDFCIPPCYIWFASHPQIPYIPDVLMLPQVPPGSPHVCFLRHNFCIPPCYIWFTSHPQIPYIHDTSTQTQQPQRTCSLQCGFHRTFPRFIWFALHCTCRYDICDITPPSIFFLWSPSAILHLTYMLNLLNASCILR